MVYVAEESVYGQGYREINQQLAKENGDLRQQLSQALQELYQQRIEIHQKDVEIVQLRGQLKDLSKVQERYKAIRDIVGRKSVCEETVQAEKECDESQSKGANGPESCYLVPIPEATEHEEKEDEDGKDEDGEEENRTRSVTELYLNRCSPVNDSLEPAEVTSVPPVDYCERTMQTPSIWNCLDTLGSPSSFPRDNNHHNNDIIHSTPVQPPKAANKKEPEPEPAPRYNLRKRAKR